MIKGKKTYTHNGLVVNACNFREVEAEESRINIILGYIFAASLGYMRPCLKKQKQKPQKMGAEERVQWVTHSSYTEDVS